MAAEYDIVLDADAFEPLVLTYTDEDEAPVDLTGCAAEFWAKETEGADPYLTMTDADGTIVLGGASGVITLMFHLAAIEKPRGLYKLRLVQSDGIPRILMRGVLIIKP